MTKSVDLNRTNGSDQIMEQKTCWHVAIKIPTFSIRNMFLFAGMFHLRSSQKFESLVSIETIYQKTGCYKL